MVGQGAVGDVVGRLGARGGAEGSGLAGGPVDEDVTVTDAGVELQAPAVRQRAAEGGVQGLDEGPALLAGDVAGGEVAHGAVGDVDGGAAGGPVVGAEADGPRRRFQRGAAAVNR